MTEQVEQEVNEPTANPYNAKKSWHTPDAPSRGNADTLFFDDSLQQATSEEAPVEEEAPKKTRTNYKKRYDDLKKHYDEKVAEFKQREQELVASAAPSYTPPKSIDDLAEFKEKYPDLYDTVETVAHLRSQEETETLRSKMTAIEQRELEITKREAQATLRQRHPDFEELKSSEDFHSWAKEQPDQIQDWIYDNPDNANLAVKAIDLYKLEKGIKTSSSKRTSSKSQSTGSAADMVSTKTTSVNTKEPKIWTRREIASLSIDDYDKYEKEIDQAVIEGRVVS